MKKAGRIGLVFGVFDSLHKGHEHFLTEAQERCDELYVAVAQDSVVESLKGKKPRQSMTERIQALESYDRSLNVIEGDMELGTWKVLRNIRPDIVFVGYDQEVIETEIRALSIQVEALSPHEPDTYKSTLLA
jgi:cytidyltransferase-like protein